MDAPTVEQGWGLRYAPSSKLLLLWCMRVCMYRRAACDASCTQRHLLLLLAVAAVLCTRQTAGSTLVLCPLLVAVPQADETTQLR